jgi:hypothetical protein
VELEIQQARIVVLLVPMVVQHNLEIFMLVVELAVADNWVTLSQLLQLAVVLLTHQVWVLEAVVDVQPIMVQAMLEIMVQELLQVQELVAVAVVEAALILLELLVETV